MEKAYGVVKQFEESMAAFTGAPLAVAVESCSAALFLCFKHINVSKYPPIEIPKITFPSVPMAVINAGGCVKFIDGGSWQQVGWYRLYPTEIIDSAKFIGRGMYNFGTLTCLSFHSKKSLPIGRGGMILTDSSRAYEWLKIARNNGRHEVALPGDKLEMVGWDMYMQPEQAARGLELLPNLKDVNLCKPDEYQDLSKYKFLRG